MGCPGALIPRQRPCPRCGFESDLRPSAACRPDKQLKKLGRLPLLLGFSRWTVLTYYTFKTCEES